MVSLDLPFGEVWEDTSESDYDNDPGFRLLAVRDKQTSEPGVKYDSVSRIDYKVAYFEDPRFGSCSFQGFLDDYYPELHTRPPVTEDCQKAVLADGVGYCFLRSVQARVR